MSQGDTIATKGEIKEGFIARSALYVRGIVKIGCSVCSFVRPFVRSFVRSCQILMIFTEKKVGGSQMPPSSEVLKHRF